MTPSAPLLHAAKITQLYPALEEGGLVEEIIPKKADIK